MHPAKSLAALLILSLLDACSHRDSPPITPAGAYYIPASEIPPYKRAARQGDAAKAKDLYLHYSYAQYSKPDALYWLTLSARSGDVVSQYNLGQMYKADNNLKQARFWYGESARGGYAPAREQLKKLSD